MIMAGDMEMDGDFAMPTDADIGCCKNPDIETCLQISIEPSSLGKETLFLPGGEEVSYKGHVNNNTHSYKYTNDLGSEALFNYNPQTGGVHGHMTYNRRTYIIEFCGEDGHVIIEYREEIGSLIFG